MHPIRVIAVVAVLAAALSACSSVVAGRGTASTSAQRTGPAPSSASASTSGRPAANRFARTPVSTAVGDPVALDFCAALGLATTARPGYRAAFNHLQYVPGCNVLVTQPGRDTRITVSVYVLPGNRPTSAPGRTTTTLSGVRAYRYPYGADSGNCERDLVVTGLTAKVTVFQSQSGGNRSRSVNCAESEAVTGKLAAALAHRSLPPLGLASPSLTSLDGCKIAKAAGLTSLSLLGGASVTADDFGIGCGLIGSMTTYIDPVILSTARPDGTTATQAGRHRLWAGATNDRTLCAFTSVQGRTARGGYEALSVVTTPAGTEPLPTSACDQTQQALVKYLDTAGLS